MMVHFHKMALMMVLPHRIDDDVRPPQFDVEPYLAFLHSGTYAVAQCDFVDPYLVSASQAL